jgi:4'-phosphopantetheinyl transferase
MIEVYAARFAGEMPAKRYQDYLSGLPAAMRNKNARYRRWQDRHRHLLGGLLLAMACERFGGSSDWLYRISHTRHGRPYIEGEPLIDFNISHSGNYVMCAMAMGARLGIDIEKITRLDFEDFTDTMTKAQWDKIREAERPEQEFFRYWTLKESIIKADSRGLNIPLNEILIRDNRAAYDKNDWYLHELVIDAEYCASIAISEDNIPFRIEHVHY